MRSVSAAAGLTLAVLSSIATNNPNPAAWSQTVVSPTAAVTVPPGETITRYVRFAVDPDRVDDLVDVDVRIEVRSLEGGVEHFLPNTGWTAENWLASGESVVLPMGADVVVSDFYGCEVFGDVCAETLRVQLTAPAGAELDLVGAMDVEGDGSLPTLDVWID